MATESKKVRRDAFVKSVRPDPKSTEDLVLLQGYIGDSDLTGHVRVYSDPALSDFIELPEQDILYCDPVATTEDPLGGSRLWVKQTTVFTAGDPRHANRIKSSFLEGDIVRAFGDVGNIPRVVAPSVVAVCHVSSKPKSCCETQVGTPCTVTHIQPTCLQTCNQPSICRPCEEVSKFQPSCFKTCDRPTPPLSLGCTFGGDCTALTICLQFASQPPVCQLTAKGRTCDFRCGVVLTRTRPGMTCDTRFSGDSATQGFGAGYAGGFNPYDTANYGY